jgi:hypothetical protein
MGGTRLGTRGTAASNSCDQNSVVGVRKSHARWHGMGKILDTHGRSNSGKVGLGMRATRGRLRISAACSRLLRARGLPARDLGAASRLPHTR